MRGLRLPALPRSRSGRCARARPSDRQPGAARCALAHRHQAVRRRPSFGSPRSLHHQGLATSADHDPCSASAPRVARSAFRLPGPQSDSCLRAVSCSVNVRLPGSRPDSRLITLPSDAEPLRFVRSIFHSRIFACLGYVASTPVATAPCVASARRETRDRRRAGARGVRRAVRTHRAIARVRVLRLALERARVPRRSDRRARDYLETEPALTAR